MPIGDRNIDRIKGNIKIMLDKNAPDTDIEGYLAEEGIKITDLQAAPSKVSALQEITPEWAGKYPNVYGAVMAARKTLGPLVEVGGAAGGAALGAPAGGVGAVAGTGLGYAGIRQALDALDEAIGVKKPATLPEAAVKAGKDIALGATMEAGGQIAGKALEAGAGKIAQKGQDIARKMYASSLKMGTGKKLSQAERASRIETGLEIGAVPKEKSLAKVENMIDELDTAIQKPIDEAAKQGKTVKTEQILSNLDNLKTKFADQAVPDDDLAAIDKARELFSARRGEEIPIDLAQKIKKGTYIQLKGKYGKLGAAAIESEKTIARGLKEEIYAELEKQYPQLRELGQKEGAYIALQESLENAVKRIQNRDIIGIGTPIATGMGGMIAGTPGAIAALSAKIADMPIVKARLAIALNKAAKHSLKSQFIKQGTALSRGKIAAYTGLAGISEEEE